MKYVGSKGRHAKQILPIILAGRKEGQAYVEPFVGGANTIQHVNGRRVAGDAHKHLIHMWDAVSRGWIPDPERISEDDYEMARAETKDGIISPQNTFLGFPCSFGGKWFGGYARGGFNSDGTKRSHANEAYRGAVKQFPKLLGVEFHHCGYDELPIPPQSIIYCDPPYAGVQGYATGGFDHGEFWQWVRRMTGEGNTVFVSEYSAPDDFECVCSKSVNSTLDKDTGTKKAVERLFKMKS